MHEPPPGPDLLDAARKTLLEELLPALPPEKHYAALMVANAITIAARIARHDPTFAGVLAARARALAGEPAGFSDDAESWRQFSAAIRAGRFDPGSDGHDGAYDLLRTYAEARCAISSRKALRRRAG
jgi:hypothetical protein